MVLALATIAVAGCGGDEESASEQWAGDVCSQLSTWVTGVEEAVRSLTDNPLSLVTVTSALATTASAVRSTFERLQSLDGGKELRDGFEDAASCDSLRQQVDTIGD